ncbi:heme-binding protein [Shewanella marina]|uniref:heme-binding protein n=1 Tax=Shewanella marina TaxID=487319 RepID=UPI0004712FB6|nr:heme-binding protein [Shewanella marina]
MEKQLVVDSFSNKLAMDIGLKIIQLAKARNLCISVAINRINHIVFLYLDDGLPADKHCWLNRKANLAMHFEESSLAVKQDLINGAMTLAGTFALDETQFVARGGAIPIMVRGSGLIGAVTVTGLQDTDDHQLIVDALAADVEFIN